MSANEKRFDTKKLTFLGVVVSLGIVFGDIGTSPLYVMKAIVNARAESGMVDEIFLEGALSCIIWTLTLQTTVKYVLISLRAHNKGEGGILALFSLVKGMKKKWLYIVAIIGAATLVADGVISPSLTTMSAIEGIQRYKPDAPVVPITCIVLFIIFVIQQFGTSFLGKFFGPIMISWFLMLAVMGLIHIADYPAILKSFNPYYAIRLIVNSPKIIIILGAVFLCTTGAEALYSDLGHCGAKNIRISWIFVKISLILNYLGQVAWTMENFPKVFAGENPFFAVMPHWFIIPGVLMATAAAITASQSLITGSFTIFSEAMALNFWPFQKIDYPSGNKGQMYIPKINWGLLFFCLMIVLYFGKSEKMEAAYGLSITVTMLMTTILLTFYLAKKKVNKFLILGFACVYLTIELGFFSANIIKFFDNGWITVFLAGIIAVGMFSWYNGRKIKTKFIEFVRLKDYVSTIQDMKLDESIPKYATNLAYFSRSKDPDQIESKIIYSIIRSQPKRADHYFILSVKDHQNPYTFEYEINEYLPSTIYRINFILGFKVERLLSDYLQQVLEDMTVEGILPDRSSYPSLRNHNIPPDLQHVVIDNVYINDYLLTVKEKIIMNLYNIVRKVGSNDLKSFGLSSHNVVVESAPLLFAPIHGKKITKISFKKIDP